MKQSKIEIFVGTDDLFYFRFKAANGKIVAQSEGYTRRENVWAGIEATFEVMADALKDDARIIDLTR